MVAMTTLYIAIQCLFKIKGFLIVKEKVIHVYSKEYKVTPRHSPKIPVLAPRGSFC